MTELEKAIMGEEETEETAVSVTDEFDEVPCIEQDETYENIIEEEFCNESSETTDITQDLPEEDITVTELRRSSHEVERLKDEIKQENEQLDIKFAEVRSSRTHRPITKRKYFYIGTFDIIPLE